LPQVPIGPACPLQVEEKIGDGPVQHPDVLFGEVEVTELLGEIFLQQGRWAVRCTSPANEPSSGRGAHRHAKWPKIN